jgi:hypothetical protein
MMKTEALTLIPLLLRGATIAPATQNRARGPLRIHPSNPRYFTDGSGKAIYLTGSHTWNNLQDGGAIGKPIPRFDYKY